MLIAAGLALAFNAIHNHAIQLFAFQLIGGGATVLLISLALVTRSLRHAR